MLQNPRKTLGFKENMIYKIPPGGGGKPYPASCRIRKQHNAAHLCLYSWFPFLFCVRCNQCSVSCWSIIYGPHKVGDNGR